MQVLSDDVSTRTSSKASTGGEPSKGVPATATSAFMGTDSGCSGSVASCERQGQARVHAIKQGRTTRRRDQAGLQAALLERGQTKRCLTGAGLAPHQSACVGGC